MVGVIYDDSFLRVNSPRGCSSLGQRYGCSGQPCIRAGGIRRNADAAAGASTGAAETATKAADATAAASGAATSGAPFSREGLMG